MDYDSSSSPDSPDRGGNTNTSGSGSGSHTQTTPKTNRQPSPSYDAYSSPDPSSPSSSSSGPDASDSGLTSDGREEGQPKFSYRTTTALPSHPAHAAAAASSSPSLVLHPRGRDPVSIGLERARRAQIEEARLKAIRARRISQQQAAEAARKEEEEEEEEEEGGHAQYDYDEYDDGSTLPPPSSDISDMEAIPFEAGSPYSSAAFATQLHLQQPDYARAAAIAAAASSSASLPSSFSRVTPHAGSSSYLPPPNRLLPMAADAPSASAPLTSDLLAQHNAALASASRMRDNDDCSSNSAYPSAYPYSWSGSPNSGGFRRPRECSCTGSEPILDDDFPNRLDSDDDHSICSCSLATDSESEFGSGCSDCSERELYENEQIIAASHNFALNAPNMTVILSPLGSFIGGVIFRLLMKTVNRVMPITNGIMILLK